ncbi:MAG: phosphomannomutase, partial [Myxococcota bacterium]
MNPHIFKEYDIRGIVDKDLGPEVSRDIARAVATYLVRHGAKKVTVGQDCRLSSPDIAEIVIAELKAAGLYVLDLGVVPSPVFYFSLFHFDADGGIVVTASHNPSEYNGMKVALGKTTIFGDEIQKLRAL